MNSTTMLSSFQIACSAAVLLVVLVSVPRWRFWGWSMLAGIMAWAVIEFVSLRFQHWMGWSELQSELAGLAVVLISLLIGVAARDQRHIHQHSPSDSSSPVHFMEHAASQSLPSSDRVSGALFRRSV